MRMNPAFFILSVALFSGQPVYSQDISACDAALTKATYYLHTSSHVDWRLATLVTSEQRQQTQDQGGASAVIYGIPVGASYKDFQNNIIAYASIHNESLDADHNKLVAWSALDAAAPSSYDKCLETVAATQPGLSATVINLTDTTALISIKYNMSLNDKREIHVVWLDNDHLLNNPGPSTLKSGAAPIYVQVKRPVSRDSFVLLSRADNGGSAAVHVPHQIPLDLVQAPILLNWSTPRASSSSNQLPAAAANRYVTFSVTFYADLTGANSTISGNLQINGSQYCGSSQPTVFGDLSGGHGMGQFSCTVLAPSAPNTVLVTLSYRYGAPTLIYTAVTVN